jgi:PQ loop repeat
MLLQSLVMIVAQVIVLYICCKYPRADQKGRSLLRPGAASSQIIGGDAGFHRMATSASTFAEVRSSFWAWEDIGSYIFVLTAFNSVLVMLTMLFGMTTNAYGSYYYQYSSSYTYYQILGYLALMVEAVLPLPQLLANWKKKSVAGLSPVLIGTWFLGDAYKTFFFLLRGLPTPFVLCGAL